MRRVCSIGMICVGFLPHIIHTFTTYHYSLAVSIKYKDTFFPFRKIFIESMIAQSIIYPRANKKQGKIMGCETYYKHEPDVDIPI